jgi:WD40 repeat protein
LAFLSYNLAAAGQEVGDKLSEQLPPGAIARLGSMRMGSGAGSHIEAAVFTPDGKAIAATSNDDPRLRLWDLGTGKELHRFDTKNTNFDRLAISPDGKLLAGAWGGFKYGRITLWEAGTGKRVAVLILQERVRGLQFIDGGKTLVTAQWDGSIQWWDVASMARVRSWSPWAEDKKTTDVGHIFKGFWEASFAGDGRWLAVQPALREVSNAGNSESGSTEKIIAVFDLKENKEIWRRQGAQNADFVWALSPHGKHIAMASSVGNAMSTVEIFDPATGKKIAQVPSEKASQELRYVTHLAFSPDGSTLAMAHDNLAIHLWRFDDSTKLQEFSARVYDSEYWAVKRIGFSPDGKTLLVVVGGSLQFYDVATGAEKFGRPGHYGPVDWLSFSEDGRSLLTASGTRQYCPLEVLTWDAAGWKETRRSFTSSIPLATLTAISHDHGLALVRAKKGDALSMYDVRSRKSLAGEFDIGKTAGGFFSPTKRFVVLTLIPFESDNSALVEVASGKVILRAPVKTSWPPVERWAFSPGDDYVAMHAFDGAITVFNTATGKLTWRLGAGSPPGDKLEYGFEVQRVLAFGPGSKSLASWESRSGLVRIWNMDTGKQSYQFSATQPRPDHYGPAAHLSWSPDSRMLAVAGTPSENQITVWETATWSPRRTLSGHQGRVESLAFSPDGRLLASGSGDTTVLIWDLLGQAPP